MALTFSSSTSPGMDANVMSYLGVLHFQLAVDTCTSLRLKSLSITIFTSYAFAFTLMSALIQANSQFRYTIWVIPLELGTEV